MAQDVITVLKNEHREVEQLLEQLKSREGELERILDKVATMLIAHSHGEEDVVYPAVRDAVPDCAGMVEHGKDEHHEVEQLLKKLRATDPDDSAFDEMVDELVDDVQDHVEEEESTVLPAFENATDATTRAQLCERYLTRKNQEMPADAGTAYPDEMTRDELYERAKQLDIEGRSKMNKRELARAVQRQR